MTSKTTQNLVNCHVFDALEELNQLGGRGVHYMIIYPNMPTLRELYANYIHRSIEDNNEIVLINPFYETTNTIRQVLSHCDHNMDVSKYEKQKALLIADSMEEYFGQQPRMYFKNALHYSKKMEKNGISILADLGVYLHKSKYQELVDYESSVPTKSEDINIKGLCLYHQKDFDKFLEQQKQKLIKHHDKAIKIVETE
ncbi:MAG TPA: MEDS domain-containing protein [Nitrososphaeraceae archaeon]|jgi:hypothetical protein|nr:MEDS domain-containing protein [Nitrososphaeraceae archaeon]